VVKTLFVSVKIKLRIAVIFKYIAIFLGFINTILTVRSSFYQFPSFSRLWIIIYVPDEVFYIRGDAHYKLAEALARACDAWHVCAHNQKRILSGVSIKSNIVYVTRTSEQ
jgi:hypothetical protein